MKMGVQQETPAEIKRFLRATKDSFETLAEDGKGYTLVFGIATAKPLADLTSSGVKSYVEAISKAVSAFAGNELLSVQVEIIDQDTFETRLIKETRHAFETSKTLEASPLKAAGSST